MGHIVIIRPAPQTDQPPFVPESKEGCSSIYPQKVPMLSYLDLVSVKDVKMKVSELSAERISACQFNCICMTIYKNNRQSGGSAGFL